MASFAQRSMSLVNSSMRPKEREGKNPGAHQRQVAEAMQRDERPLWARTSASHGWTGAGKICWMTRAPPASKLVWVFNLDSEPFLAIFFPSPSPVFPE